MPVTVRAAEQPKTQHKDHWTTTPIATGTFRGHLKERSRGLSKPEDGRFERLGHGQNVRYR